ncbi:hypothetical protein Mp_6g12590 [Marchantia polymorpha subsp. ruderalis]|uniref:Uncharacterized protein n=2 Tax=Marchantia polymorpha TaxID=3197 RepID=A0AAF6BRC4_MARPO|nr:hypothetical protein MARPO_0059s0088 [Marchantia polymorpha]BBN14558.1 hypothetical protein Mp_6g12590 [Marchantia polymorpha subsp. ruderalis]|eukprot:PTQ37162.1 hypothetical protein MARPO_0059s0088 [Marchantia polymorpha]
MTVSVLKPCKAPDGSRRRSPVTIRSFDSSSATRREGEMSSARAFNAGPEPEFGGMIGLPTGARPLLPQSKSLRVFAKPLSTESVW